MEFLANHVDCHQQVTVLKDELAIRYAKLQMQYEALHKEMLDYKTRANYWEAQFTKFKSREDELKAEIVAAYNNNQSNYPPADGVLTLRQSVAK